LKGTWAEDLNIEEEEKQAKQLIEDLNDELNRRKNLAVEASWNFVTNLTYENLEQKEIVSAENSDYYKVINDNL